MIEQGLHAFRGKTVVLLQGPMGPFFRRLATDLQAHGATVHKVNFNAGDALFFPNPSATFRGPMREWRAAFAELLEQWQPDVVMLFGDCRPIHQAAHAEALSRGIELGVFEEGYLRPDYITLERFGVNGHSTLPRLPGRYRNLERSPPDVTRSVGNAYWNGVLWATLYAVSATLGAWRFPHYQHHRPLGAIEAARWWRGAARKWIYRIKEGGWQTRLTSELSRRYFLVPLQVHNDAQVREHSGFDSVSAFIQGTMRSFAQHAPAHSWLVLKHHPMDRAYHDYSSLISTLARELGIQDRTVYLHDQHLPSLLANALGVVLINSTVGLQALHHGCAVKVCGDAIFDMEGLTYQGSLAQFWSEAEAFSPDAELFARFRQYVIATTQINGSFYRRLPGAGLASGVRWAGQATGETGVGALASESDGVPALEKLG
jgi:capsular polysaccharide export protein